MIIPTACDSLLQPIKEMRVLLLDGLAEYAISTTNDRFVPALISAAQSLGASFRFGFLAKTKS